MNRATERAASKSPHTMMAMPRCSKPTSESRAPFAVIVSMTATITGTRGAFRVVATGSVRTVIEHVVSTEPLELHGPRWFQELAVRRWRQIDDTGAESFREAAISGRQTSGPIRAAAYRQRAGRSSTERSPNTAGGAVLIVSHRMMSPPAIGTPHFLQEPWP